MVANAVKARVPTRVYTVQLSGFDTHADERETQQRPLQTLDAAVTPFLQEIAGDRFGRNVVLIAYSEFGRRVRANASHGTDHGTAGPVFAAGAPVKGGFYGELLRAADPNRRDRSRAVGRGGPPRPGLSITFLRPRQHAHAVAGDGQFFVGRDHQHGNR